MFIYMYNCICMTTVVFFYMFSLCGQILYISAAFTTLTAASQSAMLVKVPNSTYLIFVVSIAFVYARVYAVS